MDFSGETDLVMWVVAQSASFEFPNSTSGKQGGCSGMVLAFSSGIWVDISAIGVAGLSCALASAICATGLGCGDLSCVDLHTVEPLLAAPPNSGRPPYNGQNVEYGLILALI